MREQLASAGMQSAIIDGVWCSGVNPSACGQCSAYGAIPMSRITYATITSHLAAASASIHPLTAAQPLMMAYA